MKFNLIEINEDRRRILYKINQEEIIINNKIFKCNKNTANLSTYLNSVGSNLITLLNISTNNKCINCDNDVEHNRFERNIYFKYKYCSLCEKEEIIKKYDKIKCIICSNITERKNIIYSTCGDTKCLNKHHNNININITKTHWTLNNKKDSIIEKRSETRKKNDLLLNRHYIPWNKGKVGIYSKETIEKIRNATIKQMKEGRIKKTGIEKKIEAYLLDNNINYKYSFIYMNRQFDFLLIDYDLIIEVQGDYWHANPNFWDVNDDDDSKKKLYETQKMKIKDDLIKKEIIVNSQYDFIYFWENDINNNFEYIIEKLNNKIKNKK